MTTFVAGQPVKLKTPSDDPKAKLEYEVMCCLDNETVRLKGQDGTILRVHKSRIYPADQPNPLPTCVVDPKKKEKAMSEPVEKKPKKKSKYADVELFDAKAWAMTRGGRLWSFNPKFNAQTVKLVSYFAIDEKNGLYYTINAYRYPGGKIGNARGEGKYPLKGFKCTVKQKTAGGMQNVSKKGTETAEEKIAEQEKKGYKKVDLHTAQKNDETPAPVTPATPVAPEQTVVA